MLVLSKGGSMAEAKVEDRWVSVTVFVFFYGMSAVIVWTWIWIYCWPFPHWTLDIVCKYLHTGGPVALLLLCICASQYILPWTVSIYLYYISSWNYNKAEPFYNTYETFKYIEKIWKWDVIYFSIVHLIFLWVNFVVIHNYWCCLGNKDSENLATTEGYFLVESSHILHCDHSITWCMYNIHGWNAMPHLSLVMLRGWIFEVQFLLPLVLGKIKFVKYYRDVIVYSFIQTQ